MINGKDETLASSLNMEICILSGKLFFLIPFLDMGLTQ